MNRLIEKLQFQINFNQEDIERLCLVDDDSFRDEGHIEYLGEENKFLKEMIDKLKALQSLETELGIDLITLFKALKDGVWISLDNVFFNKLIYISSSELSLKFYLGKWYICYYNSLNKGVFYLDLKDFNKKWWLEKPKENEDD